MFTEPRSQYEAWEHNMWVCFIFPVLHFNEEQNFPRYFLTHWEEVKNYDQFLPCSAGTLLLCWLNRSHWKKLGFLFHVSGGFFRAAGFGKGAEYSVLNVRSSCYHLLDENWMDEQQWIYLPEISNANEQLAVVLALASIINLIRPELSATFLDVLSLVLEGH